MISRKAYAALAVALAVVAFAMPTEWYATIPRFSSVESLPFSGVNFLRLIFLLEAILVALLAVRGTRYVQHLPQRNPFPNRQELDFDISRNAAAIALAAITLFGLWLRIHHLDLDLWLDEVSPLFDYRHLSAAQVMGSYLRSNNHLLNTLLTKATMSMFGESEVSIRLPAMLFGVVTIPAIYWFARFGLSRIASLGAALLLACSYHHIFFSQNARGYTAYLFFALLSTGWLLRGLRDDRFWQWALYVACVTLGMASLALTAFVASAHVLLAALTIWRTQRYGEPTRASFRRVFAVFAIAGLLAFQIYAAAVPEAYITLTSLYTEPATGFALFSSDLAHEMIRGLTAGFGNPLVLMLAFVAGAFGYAALLRISWPLGASLALPLVLTVILLIARGLTLSPRFFLLGVPLAMLSAAAAVQVVAVWLTRKTAALNGRLAIAAVTTIIALGFVRSLPYYYRTPKQSYRSAIRYLEARREKSAIFIVGNAEMGMKYYIARSKPADSASFVYTREAAQLKIPVSPNNALAVTTFARALRIDYPAVARELETSWQRDTTFSATVGDGEITVWSRKAR